MLRTLNPRVLSCMAPCDDVVSDILQALTVGVLEHGVDLIQKVPQVSFLNVCGVPLPLPVYP
jgi:hypothetical protein